jgi:CHASE2 domain-containing sensor protein
VTSNIRKDRMRPAELLAIAAGLAAFVGVIVALSTRPGDAQAWTVVIVFTGVAFIGALVMLAMLALSFKPNRDELQDLDDQDHPDRPTRH